MNNKKPNTGEIWQHYKTKGEYEIINTGRLQVKESTLDMAECVIYKALTDNTIWIRPIHDFMEEVTIEGGATCYRFTKVR
ncbi:MAG: hypothetical protein RI935_234 [Candidatus Parcubacteria bacterium]|jgi:hypothetical protein